MAQKVPRSRIPAPRIAPEADMSTTLQNRRRGHSDLRDRLFYIGVALFFAALGVGLQYVAPVLSYNCQRDASGAVNCTVHRRIYGLVPLPERKLYRIVSAEVESSSYSDNSLSTSLYQRFTQNYEVLILACADGTRWSSFYSSEPLGESNSALASGIQDLLAAESLREFHAWQGEKVPLLVGTAFLVPAMIVVLALLLRILLLRGYDSAGLGGLMKKSKK